MNWLDFLLGMVLDEAFLVKLDFIILLYSSWNSSFLIIFKR